MDPIGFGLEGFDGIGRARQGALETYGAVIEAGSTTGEFDNTRGLLDLLANSNEVFDCFARQWFRYAYGLMENQSLTCMLRDVQDSFRASGGNMEDLLVALVLAPHFRKRTAEGGTPEPMVDAGVPMPDAGVTPMMDASIPPAPEVDVELEISDRWPTGYCARVVLTNETMSSATWTVPVTLESGYSMTSHWSSTAVSTSGSVVSFVGLAWNATLAPGATTNFGFCAER
jgi:cellulase/cellobiase CelA1